MNNFPISVRSFFEKVTGPIQVLRHFARYANLVDSVGERVYNCNSSANGKFLDAHFLGSIAVNGSRRDFNLGVDSFVDPFAKSHENLSPDEDLVSKEELKKLMYQNFATGSGHILIPFIIGIGAGRGTDTIADIFGRYASSFW